MLFQLNLNLCRALIDIYYMIKTHWLHAFFIKRSLNVIAICQQTFSALQTGESLLTLVFARWPLSNTSILAKKSKILETKNGASNLPNFICCERMMVNKWIHNSRWERIAWKSLSQHCNYTPILTSIPETNDLILRYTMCLSGMSRREEEISTREEKLEVDGHPRAGRNMETSFPLNMMKHF